jgi:GTPase Era involved in 16S rRNA processing
VKPTILVCGQTGTGKSSIVNFRLRKPVAKVGNNAESVRNGFPPPKYENDAVIFYDCDGYEIGSADVYKNKLIGFLSKKTGKSGIHLVWYTINAAAHRVTDFDREIVDLISQDFNIFILLTKIDDCDEDGLCRFCDEVSDTIPEIPIYKVSIIKKIQNYTDWDALVKSTTEALSTVVNERDIVQKLQKLTKKADSVIEKTITSTATISVPIIGSVALIPVLSRMVSKILTVYGFSLNDNAVSHVIMSVLPKVIEETTNSSGLNLFGLIVGATFGGVSNALIARSLGEATIDLCNKYLSDKLLNGEDKRNFEDIFTSNGFAQSFLANYRKNKS